MRLFPNSGFNTIPSGKSPERFLAVSESFYFLWMLHRETGKKKRKKEKQKGINRTLLSNAEAGAGIAQLVVHGLAVHGVAGSILLWGHFPVEGIFPLELTWVQTPFPQNSFGWEYKARSSLCTHAFHRTDSKDPDVHVLDGWMPATKTHPARTIHEDGMWLP